VGQLPVAYDYKPSKAYWLREGWGKPYADMSPEPLFVFGHGLSYTRFAYANLRIAPSSITRAGTVEVSTDVTNVGKRPGREVVQLYLHDPVATVVVPVQRLRGFEKVSLGPGETKTVRFTLGPSDLALLDGGLHWTVEPGAFEVGVGSSSRAIHLRGRFEVLP
jgi:beta-glucosidase